jgi:ribonuclease P protein component
VKPQGLPPDRRVRRRGDFQRAYADGWKVVSRAFVLFARANGTAATRLGVTATRKTGNAVTRNRARRIVREAFRTSQDRIPAGYDIVVVVRPPLLGVRPRDLVPDLVAAAVRATERAE